MNVFYRYLAAAAGCRESQAIRNLGNPQEDILIATDKTQRNGPKQKEASAFLRKIRFSRLKKSL